MNFKTMIALAAAAAMAACSGKTAGEAQTAENEASEQETTVENVEEAQIPLEGEWMLVDYQGPESIVTIEGDNEYQITFNGENSTFSMATGCNGLFGQYRLTPDSLVFENMGSTQMLCNDMAVEDAMKALLPRIDSYSITPDSTLRLRSDARIMATFKRVAE